MKNGENGELGEKWESEFEGFVCVFWAESWLRMSDWSFCSEKVGSQNLTILTSN